MAHDHRSAFNLLDGKVRMHERLGQDRPSIEALLLAAASSISPGGKILDVGCGSGVVALCIAVRLADVDVSALDISSVAIDELRANIGLNGLDERVSPLHMDLGDLRGVAFDQVVSNPPFHDASATRPADADRDRARFGDMDLSEWIGHCSRLCRPRGRVVLILRADRIATALRALDGPAGDLRILPIHSRSGEPANRVLIRARKAVRTPPSILAGLVLHNEDGSWTEAALRILRQGAAIDWESGSIA